MNHIKLIEAIKEKHLELIEQIEELKFGTIIEMRENGEVAYGRYYGKDEHFVYQDNDDWSLFMPEKGLDYIIIGNLDLHILSRALGYGYIIWEGSIFSIELNMYEPHDINEIVKLPNGDPTTWSKELIDTIIELI